MNHPSLQLANAERLQAVTQRVGFALWQLQELEGAAAQFYVLVALAKRGMGIELGTALVVDAQAKTFGTTVSKLVKANHLPADIEPRLQELLKERNWLVHGSLSSSRSAIFSDSACAALLERLDAIAEESRRLLKAIGTAAEAHVQKHGVTAKQIEELAAETLKAWHIGDAA